MLFLYVGLGVVGAGVLGAISYWLTGGVELARAFLVVVSLAIVLYMCVDDAYERYLKRKYRSKDGPTV